MQIQSLSLRRFRNIDSLDWRPTPGLNLVWGANGQGKTNLLEGIHLALCGRSFRTRRDEDCLPWGLPEEAPAGRPSDDPTMTQVLLKRRVGERRLRVLLGKRWKRAFADGKLLPRLGLLMEEAAVVTFTPEDVALFKGPPAARRGFIDMTLSQLSSRYLENLQRYHQALRQLNAVYRNEARGSRLRESARAYYDILAGAAGELMIARGERLRQANQSIAGRFAELGGTGQLSIHYDPDVKALEFDPDHPDTKAEPLAERYIHLLESGFDHARRLKTCPFGVHRDDYTLELDGQDLRRYGSQGQHRLAALTLKLEAARWVEQSLDDPPILLLDDFGSELDPHRRETVLGGLKGTMQVFITATDPHDLGTDKWIDQARSICDGHWAESHWI